MELNDELRHFKGDNGKSYDVPAGEVESFLESAKGDGVTVEEVGQQEPVEQTLSFRGNNGKTYKVPSNEVEDFRKTAADDGVELTQVDDQGNDLPKEMKFKGDNGKTYVVPTAEVEDFRRQAAADGVALQEMKDLGVLGTLKTQKEAEFGRKLGAGEAALSYVPIANTAMSANEKRKEYVLRRLYEGDYKNYLEGVQLAQSIDMPADVLAKIREAATQNGPQNLLGGAMKADEETAATMFKEWAGPLLAERIKAREEAQQKLANNDTGFLEDAAVGLVGGASALASMANWQLAAATLPMDAINRGGGLRHGQWTVDEKGNPSRAQLVNENGQPKVNSDGTPVISQGDSDAAALAKGFAGAAAERFIWMGLGKVVKSVGGALLKNVPGLDKMLGKVAGKPIAWSAGLEKKLSESERGRWLLKTGEILSNVNDTIHVGSLLPMMLKSRLTELADDVVGLNVANEGDREKFMDWAKKFVSVDDNVELLTSLIGLHVAMGGYSALRARSANRAFRADARKVLVNYLDDAQMDKMSNEDLQGLSRILQAPGLTAERAAKFLEDCRAEQAEARQKVESGEKLTEVQEGLDTLAQRSDRFIEGAEKIVGKLKSDEQKAIEAAEQARNQAILQAEWEENNRRVEEQQRRDELSRIRGAEPSEQMAELEKRGVTSWEDARTKQLIGQDEQGRWTGGARQAINIYLNGSEKMKAAVKNGEISGDLAEELLTLGYCELGNRPKPERDAMIDRIIDECNGDAEAARARIAELKMNLYGNEALAPGETRQPETAYEGAVNAERMKGTELRSEDGALLGCERFKDVKISVNEDGIITTGLTDALMSAPENQADVAALLVRLNAIAEKTGLPINFGGDENALRVANGIMDAVEREGLAKLQKKMDTRSQLFGTLMKTTLGNGVTYDETSFKAALEKTGNGRQFVDNHGNIYGFVDSEGVIHFNPTAINYNTPIHEYGHVALEAVKKINGNLWKKGMDLVKDSPYYRELLDEIGKEKDSPYSKFGEDYLRDEALARMIGDKGERLIEGNGLGAELKAWLREFWQAFKGAFGVADLTDEQIDKMTLGNFVDAINAELLRGKEFGTKKAKPLEKRSIRRFEEDQNSGSNGMLRWKNDRGYLFAIPVDMERTQPGGKVVFARDDANVTDWIQNALNGYTLRLSKSGKLYVEGRDGLPPELAEIFGRYPTIGMNDGIFEQIASETGRPARTTPEALVEALRKDRENYNSWTRDRNVEAEHWENEKAREEAEAQQRWEQSGMSVVDYVRSRAEEGDPAFDLDWETAREIERDRAAGRFQVERQKAVSARINSVMDDLSTIETALEKDRTKKAQYYRQINERYGSEYEFDLGVPFGTISKFIPQKPIRLKLKTLLRKKKEEYKNRHPFSFADAKDIVEKINDPAFILKRQRSLEGVRAFYETTSGKVFCASILPNGEINEIDTLYPKDIERLVNVVKSFQSDSKMLLDCDKYKTLSILERQYNTTIIPENRKGLETAISVLKSFGGVNGGNGLAKMSYAQPSLFDQVYQQTFDFNRKAEQPKQQELDLYAKNAKPTSENAKLTSENANPTFDNAKQQIRTDKIEDVGKKIAGARKDILKNYVAAIDDATREQLYALPFSKAFKRPDLVKAVQTGTMREQDANFYEAILSTIVQKKPLVTARDARMKKYRPDYKTNLDKWVDNTQNALSILKQFLGLDEAGRDQFIRTVLENKHINVAADQQRIEEVKRYNPGSDIKTGECYTPNPIYVTSEVLKRIGHKIGDKVDIPFAIKPNTVFDSYRIVDAKGDSYYKLGTKDLESAIDNLAYLTKLKRGDTDIEHPDAAFTISPGRSIYAENGQYRVYWGKGTGLENQRDFPNKEEAEAFAKTKDASQHPMSYPVKAVVGKTDYSVRFVNNVTGEVIILGDKVFETKEEAQRYFDENREDINDLANSWLAKKAGKPKSEMTADKLVQVGYNSRSENHWVVFEQDKDAQTVIRSFKTSEEANKYRDEIKADYLEQWKKNKEDRKKFVYFDTGDQKRIGEDYRDGKDVKAEDFMNEFGFRGVQFGNWTNQADRQMAVNQAYDAFMDLSKLIGIPPKALSLNGELGIAFGARGSGSALAHYEPSEVVINLTKTKGAGSLAHEWWHALDNYFARAAGSKGGMVTDSDWLKMRSELREAFNAFTRNMEMCNYGIRSKKQGAYWGRMHEITARFLAEWVDQSLKKQGRLNTFLSRGVNEEGWLELNYNLYRLQMQAAKTEPVSIEEFEKNPKAYQGFPYPTKKEVEEFGENVRRIFDTIKVREEGEGANTTYALFSTARPNGQEQFSAGSASPRFNRRNFIAGRAMVAEDYGRGERTPGAMAASRELDAQHASPIAGRGDIRRISLPLSELEQLRRQITGDAVPAHLGRRIPGGAAAIHNKAGRLFMNADVLGVIDKTDVQPVKDYLKQHGFFMNEDSNWQATHTAREIAHEKNRSEEQLAIQLNNLAKRRTDGTEPGGFAAARQVFADQVAAIVCDMPQPMGGTLGKVQTVGKGLRAELKNLLKTKGVNAADVEATMRGEAGAFLDWAYGGPIVDPVTGATTSRGDAHSVADLTGRMFGAWLVMPDAMERQAPQWTKAIETTIANTPKLAQAFRGITFRNAMSEQATASLVDRIRRQQSIMTEKVIAKLRQEVREPISAGSKVADAKETLLVAFHDKFSPVYIRVDEKVKNYVKAKKEALKTAKTPAAKAAIQLEIDTFMGDIGRKMHKLELSRTAYERGAWNEGRRYFTQMVLLENKASAKWGLAEEDRSLYLDLQRIIETQGRSGSDGMSPRQAQIALGDMARRLGASKWRLMQQYGDEFFNIHEREILDDPRLERALGKSFVDYCRTQTHYVATKRTWSMEEIDAIETAREAARRAGVAGGDDVISQMYAFAGKRGAGSVVGEGVWTARLNGSMAAKQEVRSATWEKADPLMQFGRRNQMVLDLKDALLAAEVTGVRDLRRTDGAEYPADPKGRYGHINYMENGEKRVLVVPRQIADAFRIDPDNAQFLTKVNGLVRSCFIDYNVAYTPQNVKRNQDSLEKNMPGMRETYLKTGLRAAAPGVAPIVDLTSQYLVRKFPTMGNLFGKHTVFFHLPKAERWAKIVEDPTGWQQELWAAEAAHDNARVTQCWEDFSGVMEMLKGNFLVPTGKAYANNGKTNGFAFDVMDRKGLKTLEMIDKERQQRGKYGNIVNKINIFKKNQAQNEHEDVLAKTVGYLHDRMFYGAQRNAAESGLTVKRNVSIAEGERSGRLKRGIQASVAQFFNMVEKGVVRHWRNFGERPGEMLVKDGKVWMGRAIGGMLAYGCLQKWLLSMCGDDEEKAKEKFGKVYEYAAFCHRAYQNCSDYVKENYNFTPLWTSEDGWTTLIMGGALTDEDKLIVPTADYFAKWVAFNLGIGERPSLGTTIANSTFKAITPDLQLAAPAVSLLRDTVEAAFVDNPTDYFRNAPMYDNDLWEARNESWEMRGKFAAAVAGRLWNDFGGRALYAADVNGVDSGRGSAPSSLETILRKIPVLSPAIARLFKIQVGSPEKLGAPVTAERDRMASVINVCAKDLMKEWKGDLGYHERDPKGFEEKIQKWTERYGFTPYHTMKLKEKYYNGWIQRKCRGAYDQKKLMRLFQEGLKQGRDQNDMWLMMGEL